jgi:hypothetical protein
MTGIKKWHTSQDWQAERICLSVVMDQVPIILHDKGTRYEPKKKGTEIQYLSFTGAIWAELTELRQFLGAFAGC